MLAIAAVKRSGKYAIMPSFTFAATAWAAKWAGLTPYFVDINPETLMMDPYLVLRVLMSSGVDAAIVVSYATFGMPIDIEYLNELNKTVPVVLDAASSLGTIDNQDGLQNGYSATFPIVFSLHATKIFRRWRRWI